jgi:ubiquitin-protein ligase
MWYMDAKWQARLLAEQEIMRARFPQLSLRRTEHGALQWVGFLEPVEHIAFLVAARYPDRYPYEAPRFFVEDPPLHDRAPHRYQDGSVCIHKRSWDPMRGTAASCIPLIAAWLCAYCCWLETGEEF